MNTSSDYANSTSIKFGMDQLPDGVVILVMGISGLNVLLNALCLPVSALNFTMIAQTALLHRNLKFLLLLQSFGMIVFAITENLRMGPRLARIDFFLWSSFSMAMFSVSVICLIFTGWVAFCLLCERILATLKCWTYEEDRKPHFIVFSFIFICLATFGCTITAMNFYKADDSGMVKNGKSTLCEVYTFLAVSFICMMILFAILEYNKRRYAKLEFTCGRQQNNRERLSMKYQLSENIRTSRQLLPSAFFHFFSVVLTILLYLLNYYGLMNKNALWNAISFNLIFLLFAACNLSIQISIITMHPMLNRRLWRMMAPFRMAKLWRSRIGQTEGRELARKGARSTVPVNIYGDDLLCKNADIGEYFKVLDSFWNQEKGNTRMKWKRASNPS